MNRRSFALISVLVAAALGCEPVEESPTGTNASAFTARAFVTGPLTPVASFPATSGTFTTLGGVALWSVSRFEGGLVLEARVATSPNCGINCGTTPVSRLAFGKQALPTRRPGGPTVQASVVAWEKSSIHGHLTTNEAGRLAVGSDKVVLGNTLPSVTREWATHALEDLKRASLPNVRRSAWSQLAATLDALVVASICSGENKTKACTEVASSAIADLVSLDMSKGASLAKFPNHALTAEFVDRSTLVVTDAVTRVKHTYPNLVAGSCAARISHVVNLNGIPGDEVLVSASCGAGNIRMIAIDDRSQRVYRWDIPHGSWMNYEVGDTDADHPGAEVIALMNPMTYADSMIFSSKLDPDSDRVAVQSATVPGTKVKMLRIGNLDGSTSSSIALTAGGTIHHFRDGKAGPNLRRSYTLASSNNVTFDPVDTDGLPGKEVVVRFPSTGIAIVDFARETIRSYPNARGALGTAFEDRDGYQGADLCVQQPDWTWSVLVDRTQRMERAKDKCAGAG